MTAKQKTNSLLPVKKNESILLPPSLLNDLRGLINEARQNIARQINSALVMMYWQVGKRIREDILKEKRAEYGEQIVTALTTQLTTEFGRGYSRRNLFNMLRFAEVYPDKEIVHALSAQLGWTHFLHIIPMEDPLMSGIV